MKFVLFVDGPCRGRVVEVEELDVVLVVPDPDQYREITRTPRGTPLLDEPLRILTYNIKPVFIGSKQERWEFLRWIAISPENTKNHQQVALEVMFQLACCNPLYNPEYEKHTFQCDTDSPSP